MFPFCPGKCSNRPGGGARWKDQGPRHVPGASSGETKCYWGAAATGKASLIQLNQEPLSKSLILIKVQLHQVCVFLHRSCWTGQHWRPRSWSWWPKCPVWSWSWRLWREITEKMRYNSVLNMHAMWSEAEIVEEFLVHLHLFNVTCDSESWQTHSHCFKVAKVCHTPLEDSEICHVVQGELWGCERGLNSPCAPAAVSC